MRLIVLITIVDAVRPDADIVEHAGREGGGKTDGRRGYPHRPSRKVTAGLMLGLSGKPWYSCGLSAWCNTYITCVRTPAGSYQTGVLVAAGVQLADAIPPPASSLPGTEVNGAGRAGFHAGRFLADVHAVDA